MLEEQKEKGTRGTKKKNLFSVKKRRTRFALNYLPGKGEKMSFETDKKKRMSRQPHRRTVAKRKTPGSETGIARHGEVESLAREEE